MKAERWAQERETEQRVINEAPILTVPCITNAHPIMLTWNPKAKRVLKTTKRLHQCITCNNTPSIVPQPVAIDPVPPMTAPTARALKRIPQLTGGSFNCSLPFVAQHAPRTRQRRAVPTRIQPEHQQTSTRTAIPSAARQRNVTLHAINKLTLKEQVSFNAIYIPAKHLLYPSKYASCPPPWGPKHHANNNYY